MHESHSVYQRYTFRALQVFLHGVYIRHLSFGFSYSSLLSA